MSVEEDPDRTSDGRVWQKLSCGMNDIRTWVKNCGYLTMQFPGGALAVRKGRDWYLYANNDGHAWRILMKRTSEMPAEAKELMALSLNADGVPVRPPRIKRVRSDRERPSKATKPRLAVAIVLEERG